MSVRKELAATLSERWAEDDELSVIDVLATERGLDDIQRATAIIRVETLGRTPGAPLSHFSVGILLTLVSGYADLDNAADELDDLLPAVLDSLGGHYLYEPATAVSYGDRLAFDIRLTLIASKE